MTSNFEAKVETENGKFVINSKEDVDKVIAEHYPKGLDSNRSDVTECRIGFNRSRYYYKDRLAAELHAMRDVTCGIVGYSYGAAFEPCVEEEKNKNGEIEFVTHTY